MEKKYLDDRGTCLYILEDGSAWLDYPNGDWELFESEQAALDQLRAKEDS